MTTTFALQWLGFIAVSGAVAILSLWVAHGRRRAADVPKPTPAQRPG